MNIKFGTCPKCNGTKRMTAGDSPSKRAIYGYDAETDTFPCDNCGGQYQIHNGPIGRVPLRKDGTPCLHEYHGEKTGNCYWEYTCVHCGDSHAIDSGD